MPPRYSYWTILIDDAPTAFRAHDREELLPTLAQLRRKNPNAEMKWFAQGKLWTSPEEAQAARRARPPQEPRGTGWRPGGKHEDPRDRFRKKTRERRERDSGIDQRGERGDRAEGAVPPPGRGFPPRENRPERGGPRPPFRPKSPGGPRQSWSRPPAGGDRAPFKPKGPGGPRKPWGKPRVENARSSEGDRREDRRAPGGSRPAGSRPPSKNFRPKGPGGPRKPWSGRPPTGGERAPFNPGNPGGARKPWGRPPADRTGGFRPREDRPAREGERRPPNRPGEFRARDDRPRTNQPPRKSGGWRPFKPKGPRGAGGPRGGK